MPMSDKMKRLLTIILMLLLPNFAFAKWEYLATDDEDNIVYFDPMTIKRKGTSTARGWFVTDLAHATNDGVRSWRQLLEADCPAEKVRNLSVTYFTGNMVKGGIFSTIDTPGAWRYVAPGTINAAYFKVLCRRNP